MPLTARHVMPPRSNTDAKLVCVAAVAAAHGVRGALKLRCFTEEPENVAAYGPVCDERGRELFALEVIGAAKGGVLARASGVSTREAAEALRGTRLYVPRERLPATEEDEFYHEDLVGLAARDSTGREIGRVVAVLNFGAGDVLEIATPEGTRELLPFTRAVVPEIDLAAGRLTVVAPAEEVVPPGEVATEEGA